MSEVIIDTNVPLVANRASPDASPACVIAATKFLLNLQQHGVIVLDDSWHILKEYKNKLSQSGQPGVGDAFLKWVLTNWTNPTKCNLVKITPVDDSFVEFPDDRDLANFDRSDRKFVAVACAHPDHPPIYNATDSDWWGKGVEAALARCGVQVVFLCPDARKPRS